MSASRRGVWFPFSVRLANVLPQDTVSARSYRLLDESAEGHLLLILTNSSALARTSQFEGKKELSDV